MVIFFIDGMAIRERMKTSHIVLRSVFLVAVYDYESMRCCSVYMGKYRSFDSLSTNMHAFWMYFDHTPHHLMLFVGLKDAWKLN